MKLIGFTTDEIAGVYTLLGGILHLGNILFEDIFVDGMDSVNVLNKEGISHLQFYFRILSCIVLLYSCLLDPQIASVIRFNSCKHPI